MGTRDPETETGKPSKENSPRLSEVKGNSILFPEIINGQHEALMGSVLLFTRD